MIKKWLYRIGVVSLLLVCLFGASIYGRVATLIDVYDNCIASGLDPTIRENYIDIILDPSYAPPPIEYKAKPKGVPM